MDYLVPYIRKKSGSIIADLLVISVFAATFFLYHLPLGAVMYPAALGLIIKCAAEAYSFLRELQKHRQLRELRDRSDIVILSEISSFDDDHRAIIEHLCDEKRAAEQRMTKAYDDMIDYYTVWVHQIKTPIASMRLHLDSEDTALSRKLRSDLLHIEQYVEMVLTYLRMESDTTDYVFTEVELDAILKENIRRLRGDFIMKNIALHFDGTNTRVISDEKWLSFAIGQILSNALKYTKSGCVTIALEQPKTLCIKDTGIGIAPEDIPRVFEKGFTGYHGREYGSASGLGLFLCKQICDRLGVKITIESEIDKGTAVRLYLDKKTYS